MSVVTPSDLTLELCRLNGWSVVATCGSCRYGRPLDLLAFQIAQTESHPVRAFVSRLRCSRDGCGGRCSAIVVSRQVVGKYQKVAEFR